MEKMIFEISVIFLLLIVAALLNGILEKKQHPITDGMVGPRLVQTGAYTTNRHGNQSQTITDFSFGNLYELASRGNLYVSCFHGFNKLNQSPFALWNPTNSGIELVLREVSIISPQKIIWEHGFLESLDRPTSKINLPTVSLNNSSTKSVGMAFSSNKIKGIKNVIRYSFFGKDNINGAIILKPGFILIISPKLRRFSKFKISISAIWAELLILP